MSRQSNSRRLAKEHAKRKEEIQAIADEGGYTFGQAAKIYDGTAKEITIDENYKYTEGGRGFLFQNSIRDFLSGGETNFDKKTPKTTTTEEETKKETKKKEPEPWKNPWEKFSRRDGRWALGRSPSPRMPSDLRYPYSTIDNTQDFLKFSVFEYKRSYRTPLSRRTRMIVSSGRESLEGEQGNLRDTRDLLGNIILPIPAQLADTNSIAWGESRMNELENQLYTGSMGAISGDGGIDSVKKAFKDTLGVLGANPNMVSSFFAQKAVNSLIGGNITLDQLMARSQGEILNPNLELLFSGPTLRNFTFNFKLTPRYEKEAQIIRTIIKSFKRNMAPKGSGGTVLRTPNIFQIEYMGRAKDYLNRMKLCALKNVAVNYTGDGTFATYKDGAPISSMLTLSFTELTPIYNEDYAGYDNNEDGVGF